ncbi:hypothetical protein RAE19_07875 [Rhodoferax sp. TBRC 17660]|uniref:Uncharacterized protein n=1 Tax=Rhodoferax potami TaxID=3068338 RepID=A0ABU3KMY1_9BURK|nr:hypothetical protein [Rhodoferax sp. TBRC 17660]MDT7518624.1 hypothetical protein [Rhodoferax sp. TBRC 17660]
MAAANHSITGKMNSHLLFTAELIGAINLWMISPSPAAAQRIDLAAVDLPDQFKTRTEPVFRKIDLIKEHVWDLMAEERLKEKISSWTFSESVAKTFNNGVPPVGWQGVIFKIDPSRGRTVLNISGLFATPGFTQAIEAHRPTTPNLELGIDQFRDSEREALVEIDELLPNVTGHCPAFLRTDCRYQRMRPDQQTGRGRIWKRRRACSGVQC